MAGVPSRVTLAAVAGAHGVFGEVRLKLFAESLESLKRFKAFEVDGRTLTLKSLRQGKPDAVARFAEINSREAAEALRGTLLTVDRDALPAPDDGEYYHADLIGRPAALPDGTPIGTVVAVENYGAGDILEIERPGKARFMVPFSKEAVPEVGASVVIDPDFAV